MNILITGGSGFTGANLVGMNWEKDNVTLISRKEKSKKNSSFHALYLDNADNINIVQGDIRNEDLLVQTLVDYQIDRVYHLCGQTIVSRATESPRSFYETNVMGTLSLLEAERKLTRKIPTLVVCTDKVYGDTESGVYKETMPYNPKSIYDSSKTMEDILALTYSRIYDLPIAVSRAGNIYGPADFNPRIIPNTIRTCMLKLNPVVYIGIHNKRDYVHVFDVCNAYKSILDNIDTTKCQAFNVGTCIGKEPEEVVTEILKYFPERNICYVEPKDYMLKEIGDQVSSPEKLHQFTGWEPEISFEEGIKLTVAWYKQNVGF
jgi:dTDP-glucose 4,6-dehydratase